MKIGELAKRSGLSAYTIRYYERRLAAPMPDPRPLEQARFDAEILIWIEFLGRLKTTGMPIRDMLRYAALRKQGDTTVPERQAMLETHRDQVRDRVAELQQCLLVLDQKTPEMPAKIRG